MLDFYFVFIILLRFIIIPMHPVRPDSEKEYHTGRYIQISEYTMHIVILAVRVHAAQEIIDPEEGH